MVVATFVAVAVIDWPTGTALFATKSFIEAVPLTLVNTSTAAALRAHQLPAWAVFVSQMSSPKLAYDLSVVRLTTKVSAARPGR